MISIELIKLNELTKILDKMGLKGKKAVYFALQRTQNSAKAQMRREIEKNYNLNGAGKAKINKSISVIRKPKISSLSLVYLVSGKPIGLHDFKSSNRKKGVKVSIKNGETNFHYGFRVKSIGGGKPIFNRKNPKGKVEKRKIFRINGPSITQMVNNSEKEILDFTREVLIKRLYHEIGRALE